ncbi:putative methyltransferase-domain-containing protein [Scleroderma yunnanense]
MELETANAGTSLSDILRVYSALVPPKQIKVPPVFSFSEVHDFLLNNILLNEHLNQYPPAQTYQRRFWKWALEQLEILSQNEEDSEIDELIYQHYLSLVPLAGEDALPHDSYITHYWKPPVSKYGFSESKSTYETATLLESQTTIAAGTTGLRTWRASLTLAQYLIGHADLVVHSTVLELGAGIGFLGIMVASLQLHSGLTSRSALANSTQSITIPTIVLTDVDSCVLDRCRSNVTLPCNWSSLHPNIQYRQLDWFDAISAPENLDTLLTEVNADIILGADIVFDPALVPPLVTTLSTALSQAHAQMALVALTVRNEETFFYFLKETENVLVVETIGHSMTSNFVLDQVDAGQEVKILRITKQA